MASAVPKPEPGDWLKAAADELKQGDKATLALLQESYRNVNKILQGLPDAPDAAFGDLVYRAQLERTRRALLVEQAKLFDKLGDKVAARRLRSASRAAKLSAASNAALLRLVGEGEEGQRLYEGANITAQRTVETLLARAKLSAVPLAERIYNTKSWMNKRLDTLIVSTMAAGLNAQKFAKVARDWFAPSVPGGTRYAAMRLARTEINNAFHATSIVYAQDKPWVSQMEWHLSKSHPTPDKCNEIAAASPYDVYLIPRKPHPQCMCYVTEVTPSEDEWIDRFVAGEFDDYLDGKLAEADAALGIKPEPVSTTPQPQQKVTSKTSIALPRTQAAAMEKFTDGMTRDEWDAAGANLNAIDQLRKKGIIVRDGTRTVKIHGQDVQQITYRRADSAPASELLRGGAAHDVVPKGLFKKGSLTPKQRKAVQKYETGWFMVLNSFLRGITTRDQVGQSDVDTIAAIDSAMEESVLPQDIQVYRGLFTARPLFGDRSKGDLTGFAWNEKAYGSTTTEEKITGLFNAQGSDNVVMKIHVPAGVKALELSTTGKGSNTNGPQAEITLQRDLEWKVVKDNGIDRNGVRQLEVTVSPISREADAPRADGGAAERELQPSSPVRADQSRGASPEEFDQRLVTSAKEHEALAASAWGLGRSSNSPEFTIQRKTGVNRYTGSMYRALNALARGTAMSAVDEADRAKIEQTVRWIDDAFSAVPGSDREVLVFRGMQNSSSLFGDRLDGDLSGMEWIEEANTSTTAIENRTALFVGGSQTSERVLMRILVPKDSKTIQASVANAEAEVLLAKGSRLRVVRDNGVDPRGIRLLDVELVPTK